MAIVAAAAISATPLLLACGSDDAGGSAGETLDDAAFCVLVEQTLDEAEALGDEEFGAQALGIFAELADRAPDSDVRDSLRTFGEIAERIDAVDEDDPDAFEEIFALILDPEFISAADTIETYFEGTCGLELED